MKTVRDYIAANERRAAEMVADAYRVAEVDDPTPVEDAISDCLHLLESIHVAAEDTPDPGAAVLASVERAIGHYWSEAMYAAERDDEPSDVLGGIPIWHAAVEVWLSRTGR